MEDPKKIYEQFIKKYPDIFDRRDAMSSWCVKCQKLADLSKQVWKFLDMSEDSN